ncbi:Flavoprotein-like protein YCP4 Flags: Precursor [Serendipita indica DSM 11827]|uniref:Probable 1,4-Benzoquinone reductase n=1 Tax=Serendipita indica (strain DSM 11827) TaxID=1109443 RepID=G4TDV8_SERID|nr:Flavoprotein-like protein YCP4 Flags: Precursor [Serendipita indica DSM 11827]CCA69494.1 probable 1,4-Benzoquinone reductase [Serendipita indica DSM 11827]
MTKSPKIAVIYYSMYGHIKQMAHAAVEGIKEQGGTPTLLQFAETLPGEVLAKMHAPAKDENVPVVKPADLTEYDAFVFAFPTRYGRAVAQVSALFDATGQLWATQALNGKMATIIVSTATQHGGQETTVLTTIPYLAHQGMSMFNKQPSSLTSPPGIIYVPVGYKNQDIMNMTEILGGSPYGAATLAAGDGSRQPSELEIKGAKFHGMHFSEIVSKYIS